MDVTVMSGVTDRNNVQVLMETTYQYVFMCVCFITVFVQESSLIIYGPIVTVCHTNIYVLAMWALILGAQCTAIT